MEKSVVGVRFGIACSREYRAGIEVWLFAGLNPAPAEMFSFFGSYCKLNEISADLWNLSYLVINKKEVFVVVLQVDKFQSYTDIGWIKILLNAFNEIVSFQFFTSKYFVPS